VGVLCTLKDKKEEYGNDLMNCTMIMAFKGRRLITLRAGIWGKRVSPLKRSFLSYVLKKKAKDISESKNIIKKCRGQKFF
jgi:hypothetical protein